MGVSVSLLSAAATTIAVTTAFAAGYFISFHSNRHYHDLSDDDSNDSNNVSATRNLWTWISKLMKYPSLKSKEDKKVVKKRKSSKPALEVESLAEILEDFKMVLVVRNDLKMGKGKIAAQCSHATLGLYKKLHSRAPKALSRWEMCGQVKVVLKIDSEEDMLALQGKAKSLLLPTHITIDAGRTQIAPNSRTVMAILGPADLVDDVTGGLKLL